MATDILVVADARAQIHRIGEALKSRFSKTNTILARANRRLSADLGKVYEEAARVDADQALKDALIEEVNELPDVFILPAWDAADKTTFENLLVLAMGYEDKESLRSLYGQALSNARAEHIPPTETDFEKWVQENHGIVNSARGTGHSSSVGQGRKCVESFAKSLPADGGSAPELPVKLKFADTKTRLSLLLVQKDKSGKTRLVEEVRTPHLLASAVKAIEERRSGKPLRPSQINRIEKKILRDLNRYVFKKMKYIRGGKPKFNDGLRFLKAVRALASVPRLQLKYCNGVPATVGDIGPGDRYDFEVVNPEYHELDPGRYIKGAKQWALVPYKIEMDNGYTMADLVAGKQSGASEYAGTFTPKNRRRNRAPASWPKDLLDSRTIRPSEELKRSPNGLTPFKENNSLLELP